jgi:hypothetical protein
MELPKAPLLFAKWPNTLIGDGEAIVLPPESKEVDYEAELGVVIGTSAKRVSEADALDHIEGYICLNDVSARDMQFGDGQWTRGKSPDTFCPVGPRLVPREEIEDPQAPASSTPKASRSTWPTGRRPSRATGGDGSFPISSAGASSSSTPPATASALPRMTRTGTTSGATHDARHWARPPRPGRGCLGWPRCSGSSFPANRTASAEERRPTCSRRGRRAD